METPKNVKPNEEQPASADQKSPILKTSFSCLESVFDYLELADLVSVGWTCKYLHHLAGQYYRQYYPSEAVTLSCDEDGNVEETVLFYRYYTNFGGYTNRLCIDGEECCGNDPDDIANITKMLRYASLIPNTKLKSIEFLHVCNLTPLIFSHLPSCGKSLLEMLKSVEMVEFTLCSMDARNYDNILRFCTNLKHLKIVSSVGLCKWPDQYYPTLEHLDVRFFLAEIDPDQLQPFLQMNAQIKKLSIEMQAGKLMNMIEAADAKFNELAISLHDLSNSDVVRMNDMRQRGHFKWLHIDRLGGVERGHRLGDIIDEVKGIDGLVLLDVYSFDVSSEHPDATLPNLKKLLIGKEFNVELARGIIKCFPNIEELRLGSASVDIVAEFVRCLPELRSIDIKEINLDGLFNIKALDEDRQKLAFARRVSINLHPDAFLKARWATANLESKMVGIRRFTK